MSEEQDQFDIMPRGDRRVRFADTLGMELVTVILFDQHTALQFKSYSFETRPSKSLLVSL